MARGGGRRGSIADYTPAKLKRTISEQSIAASVGGSDTQVQYNDGGTLNGMASLTFNDTSGDLTLADDKKLYIGSNYSCKHLSYYNKNMI